LGPGSGGVNSTSASAGAARDRRPERDRVGHREEGNLIPTVDNIVTAVTPRFPDYDILIIDDCSTDGTSAIADRLAASNPRIRVHHNGTNRGLGYSLRLGIALAERPYTALVGGNNIVSLKGLEDVYDRVGAADVVLSYIITDVRSLARRVISRTVVNTMNLLFGLRLKYYTGPWICSTDALKQLRTISEGSIVLAEIPVRLIYAGLSYIEVPLQPQPRTSGETKTFRLKNIVSAAMSTARMLWDVRVVGPKRLVVNPTSRERD
jgi:glycosyltransferase involved in cell wall biosynthesis